MVDYSRAPVFEQEDESEEIITSSDFSNNMPTTLPSSIFDLPVKPSPVSPLDLTALLVDRQAFADEFSTTPKTKEELEAMFPQADYKSDKYLALAKAGLALMQPTIGGRIAPAISQAGTSLVNDMGAISAREKAENRASQQGKISYEQQQEANELQLKAQAFGINQKLLETQLITNYQERAKKNAAQWEAYNSAVNTNAKAALDYGIKKFESEPVTMRYMEKGVTVERAGFRVNDQYYVPTKQKDTNGEWIYQLVPDPTSVEIISTKQQNVDDVSKNMTQHNEIYSDMMNISKNIYSLRQIMSSVDPELGGDPTRVAITGYIRRTVQKYGQIASDFSKDFFAEEYIDPITQEKKGGSGKTVWLSDLSDIVAMAQDPSITDAQKENFKMINTLLDSIEADGMALIDRAKSEDLSKHFEGDTEAERQANKNAIFARLKFDTKIPENEARAQAIIYALARARKSTGRLNLDDIERAAETLNIYNDSSTAILTKLKVVQDELLAAHQTQVDLYTRNFPNDAAILAKERGGTLSYVQDGVFVGDDYYANFFGNSVTPKKQTFTVVPKDGGGWSYVPVEQ